MEDFDQIRIALTHKKPHHKGWMVSMTWLKDFRERQDLTVQEGIPVHPELFEKIRATEQLAEPPNQIAERRMHQILYEWRIGKPRGYSLRSILGLQATSS